MTAAPDVPTKDDLYQGGGQTHTLHSGDGKTRGFIGTWSYSHVQK
jgi:hypothetical protein